MTCLLFPGRHHLLTTFQLQYLTLVTQSPSVQLRDVHGWPLQLEQPIDTVLWVITSANHALTRRNPIPAHRREVAIEDLADDLEVVSEVYLIDDLGTTDKFAEYVLKKIEVDSRGKRQLTPDNTVVACSTPDLITMYERLGFRILPVELLDRGSGKYLTETPWQIVETIFATHEGAKDWRNHEWFLTKVARATRRMYLKYGYGDLISELFSDPVLSDDGDLTETRDYNTYVRSFDAGAERKYALIKDYVVPGRVVDIGCCTGSLIQQLTQDDRLRESDFYGVEVARRLYQECLHRKEQGAFANDHVFFHQRNAATNAIFALNSIHTFTTFALTHELESYQGRDSLLHFITLLYEQLAIGGRWINVDVIGPEDKDQIVSRWLNRDDGRNEDYQEDFAKSQRDECKEYLEGVSTYARFMRFCRDFRRDAGHHVTFEIEKSAGESLIELRLADACEFMSKKDYTDNWQSEMHETFCFWSFSQWVEAVGQCGMRIHPASHAFTNPWIVENRYRDKVKLFRRSQGDLHPLEYPVTNMLLIAEKV